MERVALAQAKFDENVLDATNAWSRHVDSIDELAGLPQAVIERARAAAQAAGKAGWLFTLDAPNYQAVLTHAENRDLRHDFYQAWVTRASELGAPQWDNTRADGGNSRPAARDRAARGIRELCRILAGDQDGAATPPRCSISCAVLPA